MVSVNPFSSPSLSGLLTGSFDSISVSDLSTETLTVNSSTSLGGDLSQTSGTASLKALTCTSCTSTGAVTCTQVNVSGVMYGTGCSVNSITSGSANISGTLVSGSVNVSGALAVGSGYTSSITYLIASDNTYETTIKKFGNGSIGFNTSSSLILKGINSTDYPSLYSGSYTIEFWIYATTLSLTNQYIFSAYDEGYFDFSLTQLAGSVVATWKLGTSGSGNLASNSGTTTMSLNQWTHVSIQYISTNSTNKYRLHINGVGFQIGGGSSGVVPATTVFNSSKGFCIGARYNGGSIDGRFIGYIDEVRISTGVRYSGTSFTPPTTQFTTDGSTVILNRMESLFLTDSQVTPTPTSVSGLSVSSAGALTSNKGYTATYGNIEALAENATLKLSGSTVLSSSTLGSGVTNASLSSISPSGGTLTIGGSITQSSGTNSLKATSMTGDLSVTGAISSTGNIISNSYVFGSGIYFRAYRVGSWSVSTNQTILSGGASNFDNNGGFGNGYNSGDGVYYAPRSGVYRFSLYVRSSDTTGNQGIKPGRLNIGYSLQLSDNTYWMATDGQGRRTAMFTENIYLSAGQGWYAIAFTNMTMQEFVFSGHYLGN